MWVGTLDLGVSVLRMEIGEIKSWVGIVVVGWRGLGFGNGGEVLDCCKV